MLTNKDLEKISGIVKKSIDESIKDAFADFFEHIFEPYTAKNEKEHQEIVKEIKLMKKDIRAIKEENLTTKEYLKDHEKRIRKLETVNGV